MANRNFWAVVDPTGHTWPWTADASRKITTMRMSCEGGMGEWPQCRRAGFTVRRFVYRRVSKRRSRG